jgi:indolepyruvate ferredoxin oxidoreductase, alpha subunit
LQGLINAVWQKRDVLVIVLKNDVAAMTGGQDVPDLTKLVAALVPTCRMKLPASDNEVEQLLREELKRSGASVLVAQGKCTKQVAKE